MPRINMLFSAIFLVFLFIPGFAFGAFGDCPSGYFFDPRSGVGCKQTYCNDIPSAHWSYEGYCVCGSSGSQTENPLDPNKECYLPREDTSCPGCLAKCVHFNEPCPGEKFAETTSTPTAIQGSDMTPYEMLQDAFSKFVALGSDLMSATIGGEIKQKDNPNAFFDGIIITPGRKAIDIRFFHLNTEFSRESGAALEWNFIELGTPSNEAFIDGWSLGVGPGSVSKDGTSVNVPFTPISPNINFNNILFWFGDKWNGIKSIWQDNMPFWLGGGAGTPAIPGLQK